MCPCSPLLYCHHTLVVPPPLPLMLSPSQGEGIPQGTMSVEETVELGAELSPADTASVANT